MSGIDEMPKGVKEKEIKKALKEFQEVLRGEVIYYDRSWTRIDPYLGCYSYTLERDELQYDVRTG